MKKRFTITESYRERDATDVELIMYSPDAVFNKTQKIDCIMSDFVVRSLLRNSNVAEDELKEWLEILIHKIVEQQSQREKEQEDRRKRNSEAKLIKDKLDKIIKTVGRKRKKNV